MIALLYCVLVIATLSTILCETKHALAIKHHECSNNVIKMFKVAQRDAPLYDVYLLFFSFDGDFDMDEACVEVLHTYDVPKSRVIVFNVLHMFPFLLFDAEKLSWTPTKNSLASSMSHLADCGFRQNYEYVWVFEWDVWWTPLRLGEALGINDVFLANDFLCNPGVEGTSFGDTWHARAEKKYNVEFVRQNVIDVSQMGCLVPVVRYSKKLLNHMCEIHKGRRYFFSELAAPIACAHMGDSCTVRHMNESTTRCHLNWAPPKGVAGHLCTVDMYTRKCFDVIKSIPQVVHPLKLQDDAWL